MISCFTPCRRLRIRSGEPRSDRSSYLGRSGREATDLLRDDGEASSGFTGPRGLDAGVDGQQVGLDRDFVDHLKQAADFGCRGRDSLNRAGSVIDMPRTDARRSIRFDRSCANFPASVAQSRTGSDSAATEAIASSMRDPTSSIRRATEPEAAWLPAWASLTASAAAIIARWYAPARPARIEDDAQRRVAIIMRLGQSRGEVAGCDAPEDRLHLLDQILQGRLARQPLRLVLIGKTLAVDGSPRELGLQPDLLGREARENRRGANLDRRFGRAHLQRRDAKPPTLDRVHGASQPLRRKGRGARQGLPEQESDQREKDAHCDTTDRERLLRHAQTRLRLQDGQGDEQCEGGADPHADRAETDAHDSGTPTGPWWQIRLPNSFRLSLDMLKIPLFAYRVNLSWRIDPGG